MDTGAPLDTKASMDTKATKDTITPMDTSASVDTGRRDARSDFLALWLCYIQYGGKSCINRLILT